MSILIGLLTCHAHRERDSLVESTWAPVARQLGMRVVFLIGDGPRAQPTWLDGDYLRIPCPDDYWSLPMKTRAFAQWALTQSGWDRILKADNDSLVIPERLAAIEMDGIDYRGSEPGIKWFGYASGAGYLLSRRAAQVVADTLVNRKGAEDQLVGRALKRAGIELTKDASFDPWGKNPPTPKNQIVLTHKLDRERWLACWGQFQ